MEGMKELNVGTDQCHGLIAGETCEVANRPVECRIRTAEWI